MSQYLVGVIAKTWHIQFIPSSILNNDSYFQLIPFKYQFLFQFIRNCIGHLCYEVTQGEAKQTFIIFCKDFEETFADLRNVCKCPISIFVLINAVWQKN